MKNEKNYYVSRLRDLSPLERREVLTDILDWFFEAEHPEPEPKTTQRQKSRGLTVIKGGRS